MRRLKLRPNQHKGKLIVFEGTDGAGKTTLIGLTKNYLLGMQEREILCVKQPTDLSRKTKLFQKMMYCKDHADIDYRAVQLLTMSDRMQHTYEIIEPALQDGKIVICDRYIYTSLANMLARGYRKEKWFYEAAKHLIRPNLVFLAYVPPETAIARIKARPEESNRHLDEMLLHGVAWQFCEMARHEKFCVLDTSQNAEKVFLSIRRTLQGDIK